VLKNAGVAAGAALAMTAAGRALAHDEGASGLTGSWLVSTPGGIANGTLVTFIPGGFIRAGTTLPMETPGHGAWKQVGDHEYDITYVTIQFDKDGTFIGHRKSWLHATVDPSGTSFSAIFRGVTIDRDGVETPRTSGQNSGVRMVAEPFEAA
jgi:hypothetical protein